MFRRAVIAWRVLTTMLIIAALMFTLGLTSSPDDYKDYNLQSPANVSLVHHGASYNAYSYCAWWNMKCKIGRAQQGWLDINVYGHAARAI